jgi:HD-like signal output (HDOD) protein/ActR/RegA family two-component response regulator
MSDNKPNEKMQILFVDDEEKLLQGFKRMLRNMRHEWDMSFAVGGKNALELMAKNRFDLVVTDMRMPEMDGVQLLSKIIERHPETIRIALSGQSDEDALVKSTKLAHQFLAKPCDPQLLKETISSGCALSSLIGQIDSLPSLPSLYAELMNELNSPDGSINKIGEIVSKDLAMTAKILHLANSAYFGFRTQISTPGKAVIMLGINTVKALVLSIQIFSQFDFDKDLANFIETLWQHSMTTGILAKKIMTSESDDKDLIDKAFMSGILHDLGKLVLASKFPDKYVQIVKSAVNGNNSISDQERQIFGVTHSALGAYLTGLWGLPASVIEAISRHHEPSHCMIRQIRPLTAVHAANGLLHNKSETDQNDDFLNLDTEYLTTLNLINSVPKWEKIFVDHVSKGDDGGS